MFDGEKSWWLDDDSVHKRMHGAACKESLSSGRVHMVFYVRDSADAPNAFVSGASSSGLSEFSA
eukprot:6611977-Karenia_brevis.AAC.1